MKISAMTPLSLAATLLLVIPHAINDTHAKLQQTAYPAKPIRVVVGFSAGGTPDTLARLIGPKLAEAWGQPVVVDNRTGAGGTLAAGVVAKAAPDGYTLHLTSPSFVFNAALQPNLPYDSVKDFAGVAGFGNSVVALVVATSLGVKNTAEFIALAKSQPGKILASSPGLGSANHMSVERFRLQAGIKVAHVGFKGQPESLLEIAANRVHFTLAGMGPAMALIKDGKLNILGVTARSPIMPEVPLLSDALPGFKGMGTQCLLAPAGTPPKILQQLNTEVARIFALPDIKARLHNLDFVVDYATPEVLDKRLRTDIEIAHKLVKEAGLRPS